MKLLTRISSIRRIAWKACRSCSAALVLDVGRLVGQPRRRRVHPLAASLEHPGDRVLGEPVDLQVGVVRAQLGGDGDVAPGVAEPDRRREVQRPLRAAGGTHPACGVRRRSGGSVSTNSSISRLTRTGSRAVRAVAAAVDGDERAAGELGEGAPVGVRADAVVVAVDDEHRAAHPLAQRRRKLSGRTALERRRRCRPASSASISRPQPTQSSICLVECGSVNIWPKKNSRKSS